MYNIAVTGYEPNFISNIIKQKLAILGVPSFIVHIKDPIIKMYNELVAYSNKTIDLFIFNNDINNILTNHFGKTILTKMFIDKSKVMGQMGVLICDDLDNFDELVTLKNNHWYVIYINLLSKNDYLDNKIRLNCDFTINIDNNIDAEQKIVDFLVKTYY